MTVTRYQQKRGTAAQWAAANPVLRDGEFGIEKDTGIFKVGDGVHVWTDLPPAMDSHFLPNLGTAHDSYRLGGFPPEQYLQITGKAADSDKLDGIDSTGFLKTSDAASFLPATGKAVDADKLDGIDSTGFLKTTDAASFLGVNAKAADADKLDGQDSTAFQTVSAANTMATSFAAQVTFNSPTRPLSYYWGVQSVFPTPAQGVLPGDTVSMSGQGSVYSLWTYVNSNRGYQGWVHKGVMNCTSTTRPTFAYLGLEIFETDTLRYYVYTGVTTNILLGPWTYITGGSAPTLRASMSTGFTHWQITAGGGYENVYFSVASGEVHLRGLMGTTNALTAGGTYTALTIAAGLTPSVDALRSVFVGITPAIVVRADAHPSTDPTYPSMLTLNPLSAVAAGAYISLDISWPLTNNA